MTEVDHTLDRILAAGDALARSIGHIPGCPKVSPAVPCTCGAKSQQAAALDEWLQLRKQISEKSLDIWK